MVEGLDGALPAAGPPALEVDFQLPGCLRAGLRHPHEQRGRRAKGRGHGSGRRAPGAACAEPRPAVPGRKVSVSLSPKSLPVRGRAAPPPLLGALPAAVRPVSRSRPPAPEPRLAAAVGAVAAASLLRAQVGWGRGRSGFPGPGVPWEGGDG